MTARRIFVAELFGTFCLVFAGTAAIVVNANTAGSITHPGVAMVFGLVVMALIYAVGEVSGAHFNPAVTLGFWMTRRLSKTLVPIYLAAQFGGALLASAAIAGLFGRSSTLGATLPAGSMGQSFLLELLLTMILMVVILCVSTGAKETGIMAGIAVGGVIGFEAMCAGRSLGGRHGR